MKNTLLCLLLSALCASAQSDDPPILKPDLAGANISDGDVANEGSLEGRFEVRQGDGTIEIVESSRSGNALKLTPTLEISQEASRLPCLIFRKMPAEFPRGVTFEARIKPDPDWILPQSEILSARVSDRGTGLALVFRPTDHLLDFMSGAGGESGDFWGIFSQKNTAIQSDDWVHVAGVYNPETKQFRLYYDGQMVAESATGLELTPMSPEFSIGTYRAGYAYPFRGEISDIQVFDYPRTEDQVRADAAAK